MTFSSLGLKDSLLQALLARGYENPTDIQAQAIPQLLAEDRDCVGQAQTGTGKTAAFGLPLLQKIDQDSDILQAIILTPTRELANQVHEEIAKFASKDHIRSLAVYGGVHLGDQIKKVKRMRPHIVVGTPGRVLDLIGKGVINLSKARYAILDEADEMLDMGFIDDVREILSGLNETRNIWMFSATMPRPILKLIEDYLNNPLHIRVQRSTLSNESIEQVFYLVKERDRTEALCRLLDSTDSFYGIVFCRTKIETKEISDYLNLHGHTSDALHGDMTQVQRDLTMKRFKQKNVQLLICTDVAARGIDVDNLTHVVNFGLPQDNEAYVHRIGRTGRAGQKGQAVSIVGPMELYRLKQIERLTRATIARKRLPTVEEIQSAIIKKQLKQINHHTETQSKNHQTAVLETFVQEFADRPKEEILHSFFHYLFSENLKRYETARELDLTDRDPRQSNSRSTGGRFESQRPYGNDRGGSSQGGNSGSADMRLFVNMGKDDGMTVPYLLGLITEGVKIDKRMIRNVDIRPNFTFLEVPRQQGEHVLALSNSIKINDRDLRFEVSRPPERRNDFGGGGGQRSGGGRRYAGRY